jgi:LPS-assembly protein
LDRVRIGLAGWCVTLVVLAPPVPAQVSPGPAPAPPPAASEPSPATIVADQIEARDGQRLIRARGRVTVEVRDLLLRADEVDLDREREELRARGNVFLQQGPDHLQGERLEYDYGAGRGTMFRGEGFLAPATHFFGREVRREGATIYRLLDGGFTTCRICQAPPVDWEFRARDATIVKDEWLTATFASFWARGVPALFAPYVLFPIGERRTGLLIPAAGFSRQSGFLYRQPFFWAISASQDLTLTGIYRSRRGWEAIGEYRYAFAPATEGNVRAAFRHDRGADEVRTERGQFHWKHRQVVDPTVSIKADVNLLSDRQVLRSLTETPSEERTLRTSDSRLFATKMWADYALTGSAQGFRDLVDPGDPRLIRLPELRFTAFRQPLGRGGAFVEGEASAAYLERRGQGEALTLDAAGAVATPRRLADADAGRVDAAPAAGAQLRLGPYLTLAPRVALRETAYTRRGDGGEGGSSRELLAAEAVAESRLARTYALAAGPLAGLIHVVEPQLRYDLIPPVGQRDLPQFDPADFVSPQNRLTYAVTNRIVGRLRQADGSRRSWELFNLGVSQSLNLTPRARDFSTVYLTGLTPERTDQAVREIGPSDGRFARATERSLSNLVVAAAAQPTAWLGLGGSVAYNTEARRGDGASAGARLAFPPRGFLELVHTYVSEKAAEAGPLVPRGEPRAAQALVARAALTLGGGWAAEGLTRFDGRESRLHEGGAVLRYSTCCWQASLHYTYRAGVPGQRVDHDLRVMFELRAQPRRG